MTRSLYITLLFVLCMSSLGFAQEEPVHITLSMSPRPSTKISDWRSNRETIQLLLINRNIQPIEVRIDARLSLNGTVVANTKTELMPIITLPPGQPLTMFANDIFPDNAINYIGEVRQSAMRTGILPEGSYEICIQTVAATSRLSNSNNDCKQFYLQKFELPRLVMPEDKTELVAGFENQTNFSWIPVIPSPSMPVTYRLRIVEILPGQTSQQAYALNLPFFERKSVGATQLLWPSEVQPPITGASFAWSVQAEDLEGNPIVVPERYPQPYLLKILPTKEGCASLLSKVQKEREILLSLEERYWKAYDTFERTEWQLENAEERADAYAVQKIKSGLPAIQKMFAEQKKSYEASYIKYDRALKLYLSCGDK